MTTAYNHMVQELDDSRALINALETVFANHAEYVARGGGNFSDDISDPEFAMFGITPANYDTYHAYIAELKTWFDARAGVFYEMTR